jgi:hypothetical protein
VGDLRGTASVCVDLESWGICQMPGIAARDVCRSAVTPNDWLSPRHSADLSIRLWSTTSGTGAAVFGEERIGRGPI